MPAMFISIAIEDSVHKDQELCNRLVSMCPVDIFEISEKSQLITVEENLDECTLCNLCIEASSDEQIKIEKLYRSDSN
ncbi:MAG: ferredoxin family protein [Dehalococcoidia bacterium]|nr:ferredoxin family protein [Dehalococcoidia bacterium]